MDELKIDGGIRGLIRQLWKHCYITTECCEGHDLEGFIIYKENTGDGWFEKNASYYGFKTVPKSDCCDEATKKYPKNKVCRCGHGINGHLFYFKEKKSDG